MAHRLSYNTLARSDLFNLYSYIEERNGSAIAGSYLARIEGLCASLETMPAVWIAAPSVGAFAPSPWSDAFRWSTA